MGLPFFVAWMEATLVVFSQGLDDLGTQGDLRWKAGLHCCREHLQVAFPSMMHRAVQGLHLVSWVIQAKLM
jgi:hypothetical protein